MYVDVDCEYVIHSSFFFNVGGIRKEISLSLSEARRNSQSVHTSKGNISSLFAYEKLHGTSAHLLLL